MTEQIWVGTVKTREGGMAQRVLGIMTESDAMSAYVLWVQGMKGATPLGIKAYTPKEDS